MESISKPSTEVEILWLDNPPLFSTKYLAAHRYGLLKIIPVKLIHDIRM